MDRNEFVLKPEVSVKLQAAIRRGGVTPEEIEALCGGDMFARIRPVLRGHAEVVAKSYVIDLSVAPFIPEGYKEVISHTPGDAPFVWSPEKVRLHYSLNQEGGKTIGGEALLAELTSKKIPVFNANLLDGLLKRPELIPAEWKKVGLIFFWGTIYRSAVGGRVVRCLYWLGDRWYSLDRWLGSSWDDRDPAAVLAS